MNSYRIYLITTTLILALTLAACGASSTTGPTSTPIKVAGSTTTLPATPILPGTPNAGATQTGSGGCTNPYFPLAPGATWSYASDGGPAGG